MSDIDISPEAVEQLAHHDDIGGDALRFAPTLRALSAALTQSRAETAAVIEQSAREAQVESQSNNPYVSGLAVRISDRIRALATHDQSSALAAVIADAKAEALSGPWEDKPDALTDALELVSNRHGNGALVGLVNYLMAQNKAADARGMRKAAGIADAKYAAGEMGNPGHHILAAIPQGEMK